MIVVVDGSFLGFRSMTKWCQELGYQRYGKRYPTGTIYSFLKGLIRLREEFSEAQLVVAWDKVPSVRREISQDYKAHRKEQRESDPEQYQHYVNMQIQLNELKMILPSAGIVQYYCVGAEADDVLATLSYRHRDAEEVVLVARDKDLWQLLHENVTIYDFECKKDYNWFKEEFGIEPKTWVDVQALCGDSVDNVKGINGVGIKTAIRLLNKHGTLSEVVLSENWIDRKIRRTVMLARRLVILETSLGLSKIESNYDWEMFRRFLLKKRMKTILYEWRKI